MIEDRTVVDIGMCTFRRPELAEALRNIHRIAEIRLADKFGAEPVLGNDVWDWQENLAQHSDPGFAEKGQLTVTYLTDAHRACAAQIPDNSSVILNIGTTTEAARFSTSSSAARIA